MRKKQMLAVADSVIGTTTDVMLIMLYSLIGVAGTGSSSPIKISRSMDEAQKWLDAYNYDTLFPMIFRLPTTHHAISFGTISKKPAGPCCRTAYGSIHSIRQNSSIHFFQNATFREQC